MVTDSSANSGKNGKYDKFTGEKFTVVHVTNYYFPTLGGITTQVYYLVKHFAQRGIESNVSHFMLNEFRKTFPKVKTSGRVTYSGIDAEKFHLVHKDKLIMEYLGMKG